VAATVGWFALGKPQPTNRISPSCCLSPWRARLHQEVIRLSASSVHWTAFHGSQARAYEEYLVPAIFQPFAQALVGAANLQPGNRVLDIACGTGIVARLAAAAVGPIGRVVGVDLNPQMLDEARSHAPIEWIQASADSIPLPAGSFDLVLCQQGLQFFPDRPAALLEARRLLAERGTVVISVWRDLGAGFQALAEALGRYVGPEAGAALSRGPASLRDPAELSKLVELAGFTDVALSVIVDDARFPSAEQFVLRYLAATPLGSTLASADEDVRQGVLDYVTGHLMRFTTDTLSFPMESNLLVARRVD
jgi:ubiquinone/menaquinone biosynthesis C-methylase UbiE